MDPILYLLMGLPGAGKTTAAKVLAELTGAIRISSDEVRLKLWPRPSFSEIEHNVLYKYLDEKTSKLLKQGQSVIYDANLNRLVHREEKYELAKRLNVTTVLCWVKTPRELAKTRRIEATEHHQLVPAREDPASMFERIAEIIEPPTATESFVELDGTKITPNYIAEVLKLPHEGN